jgi:hypothetical protein
LLNTFLAFRSNYQADKSGHNPPKRFRRPQKDCLHPPSRLTSSICFVSAAHQMPALSYQPLPEPLFPLHDPVSASNTQCLTIPFDSLNWEALTNGSGQARICV